MLNRRGKVRSAMPLQWWTFIVESCGVPGTYSVASRHAELSRCAGDKDDQVPHSVKGKSRSVYPQIDSLTFSDVLAASLLCLPMIPAGLKRVCRSSTSSYCLLWFKSSPRHHYLVLRSTAVRSAGCPYHKIVWFLGQLSPQAVQASFDVSDSYMRAIC